MFAARWQVETKFLVGKLVPQLLSVGRLRGTSRPGHVRPRRGGQRPPTRLWGSPGAFRERLEPTRL